MRFNRFQPLILIHLRLGCLCATKTDAYQIVLLGFETGEQPLMLTIIIISNIFPALDINTMSFRNIFEHVKGWAKAHGINDPKTGSFNSYSLSVLIILHFQTREPAILPPLSEIYLGNMAGDLIGLITILVGLVSELTPGESQICFGLLFTIEYYMG